MPKYQVVTVGEDGTISKSRETWDGQEYTEDGKDMNAILIITLRLGRLHQVAWMKLIEMVAENTMCMGNQSAFVDERCTFVVNRIRD